MKRRLLLLIPFVRKLVLRLEAAQRIIIAEWGGDEEQALEFIDEEVKKGPLPPKPAYTGPPIPPYFATVDWKRDRVELGPRPKKSDGYQRPTTNSRDALA